MQQNGLWAEIITYIPLWFIDIGDLRPGGRSGVHIEHAVGLDKQAVQVAADPLTSTLRVSTALAEPESVTDAVVVRG